MRTSISGMSWEYLACLSRLHHLMMVVPEGSESQGSGLVFSLDCNEVSAHNVVEILLDQSRKPASQDRLVGVHTWPYEKELNA